MGESAGRTTLPFVSPISGRSGFTATSFPAAKTLNQKSPSNPVRLTAGIATITIKAAMGHSQITTTERYLHARPATQSAAAFTAAFAA